MIRFVMVSFLVMCVVSVVMSIFGMRCFGEKIGRVMKNKMMLVRVVVVRM